MSDRMLAIFSLSYIPHAITDELLIVILKLAICLNCFIFSLFFCCN